MTRIAGSGVCPFGVRPESGGDGRMDSHIYDWPEYYDWTSTGLDRDVTYYVELAKQSGGPVLDLGCGTGRISLAIARAGIPVTGLDLSPAMLDRARKKSGEMKLDDRIEWVEGDMTSFDLKRKFPLIIIPYRSFLHLLTVRDQVEALKRIHAHLADDGLLAFNIFVPTVTDLASVDRDYQYRGTFPVPGTDHTVELYDYMEVDPFSQTVHIIRYMERYDGHGILLEKRKGFFRIRYIWPTELHHLLNLCGFRITARYGSFYRAPFDAGSTELIIEARKR
ncbi:class I SAM-dependent methyltransferase [Staphylospora marina]|uniref:class I SAM-dependent methyltransferase n=1 Tax=Staphylospora marina TaxID=2490858 RepID=UPI001F15587B|nr:class I SAM-dependent methyltransferase [Staphylospora marina]